jgi:hypothetical protein
MIARAEFLAPLILTCPLRGDPPQTWSSEVSSSDKEAEFVKLEEEVIGLSSSMYKVDELLQI